MRLINSSAIFLIALLTLGCGRQSPERFIRAIESSEGGLKSVLKTETFEYSLQYCPYDYLYLKEGGGHSSQADQAAYNERENELNGLVYFVLTVTPQSSGDALLRNSPDFSTVYDYFSSLFEYTVTLGCSGKRQPCALFHVEGLYGISNEFKIHMAFENVCNQDSDLSLYFENELDKVRTFRMDISHESIKNRPKYKF